MGTLAQSAPVRLGLAVHRRASEDDVGTMAAALTYQTFLATFPLVLLGLSVVGFVLAGDPDAQRDWAARLAGAVPGLEPLIGNNLRVVVDTRVGALVVGAAGLVWRASSLSKAATHMLARVFRTPEGGLVSRTLLGLARIALLGVLGLASVALTSLATSFGGALAPRVLGIVAAAAVDLGFFALVYLILTPGGGPSLRGHLPGAALMALGWTALKLLGNWYLVYVVTRSRAAYGAVGAVFGLFAILALGSQLFLYGAELTAATRSQTEEQPGARP